MALSPIELGALVDSWVRAGRASVVEGPLALTVSNLAATETAELCRASYPGWDIEIVDSAGEPSQIESLDEHMGPYIVTVQKPADAAAIQFLTQGGFAQALATIEMNGVCQIASATIGFTTGLVSFSPWGRGDIFSPAAETKSPLEVVRGGAEARLVPADIRKWLLRSPPSNALWQDPAFQIFARAASGPLIRSLSSEVNGRGAVAFAGPPRLKLALDDASLTAELQQAGFTQVQAAAAWIYEDPVSAEQRHGLFTAEFARSVIRDESIGDVFRKAGKDILESARFAYQLSLSGLSREAIKAQADLRKAIADDVAKAADGTRTLATAIAVAIATGIGLVAARSTAVGDPRVFSSIAFVVALYLIAVTLSGGMYLRIQRRLREQWRQRFYRFISNDDYAAMVTKPAAEVDKIYYIIGFVGVIIAAVLIWLAITGLSIAAAITAHQPSSTEVVRGSSPPLAAAQSARSAPHPVPASTLPDSLPNPCGVSGHLLDCTHSSKEIGHKLSPISNQLDRAPSGQTP